MRGQTQAVTAVLITSVVIGSVATAYVWGTPLLEKRQGEAKLQSVEDEVVRLHQNIIQVSKAGEGVQRTVDFGSSINNPDFDIRINERKDYIEVQRNTRNSPYPLGSPSLVKGNSFQNISYGQGEFGIRGNELPGVVSVKPIGNREGTILTYRIEFRNLRDQTPEGPKLYKIDLTTQGSSRANGETKIQLSNQGEVTDTGSDRVQIQGSDIQLERQRTIIRADIIE